MENNSQAENVRLDIYLTQSGFFGSRSRAGMAIGQGRVTVNGNVIQKASYPVVAGDVVEIVAEAAIDRYVSRGALKLEKAFRDFNIRPDGAVALDMGSSTGGFTDCLLQHGAAMVYAVDVGTLQLHPNLRNHPQVKLYENLDIRNFKPGLNFDMVTGDLSFISLHHILPLIPAFLKPGGAAILLIKPQFEVGQAFIGKNGIVRNRKAVLDAVKKLIRAAEDAGMYTHDITTAPDAGEGKNKEFLWLVRLVPASRMPDIEKITG